MKPLKNSVLFCLLIALTAAEIIEDETISEELDAEEALKRMIQVVRPLMKIFKVPFDRITFENNTIDVARQSYADPVASASYGYAPNYSGSYYSPCCNYKSTLKKLLPILALVSLGLLALYLIILLTTTTTAGRRKRNATGNIVDKGIQSTITLSFAFLMSITSSYAQLIELVDISTWYGMLNDVVKWNNHIDNSTCVERSLCLFTMRSLTAAESEWPIMLSR